MKDNLEQSRIAFISTHGYVSAAPPLGAADTGGQVVYVLEMAKRLGQMNYRVDVWTRRFESQPAVEPVAENVRIVRAACGGDDFIPKEYLSRHIPEWCENALEIIRREKLRYEVFNTHYWDAGLAGQLLRETLSVPHIHTPHSLGIWKRAQMRRDFAASENVFEEKFNFTRRIRDENKIYAGCDLLAATSPFQIDVLADEYGTQRRKIRMIPGGYDERIFFPVSAEQRKSLRKRLAVKGKAVLAVGRAAQCKGFDLLIEAFAPVAERIENAELYLITDGEGDFVQTLKNRAAGLGLQNKTHFINRLPQKDLADYYRAADVYALSSRYEAFGMTAVEAMACGTPAVITKHGGLYKSLIYGTDAIFCDPFDPEDLAISITKPLTYARLRENLSASGARTVSRLYTWTSLAEQFDAAVKEVCRAKPAAPRSNAARAK